MQARFKLMPGGRFPSASLRTWLTRAVTDMIRLSPIGRWVAS